MKIVDMLTLPVRTVSRALRPMNGIAVSELGLTVAEKEAKVIFRARISSVIMVLAAGIGAYYGAKQSPTRAAVYSAGALTGSSSLLYYLYLEPAAMEPVEETTSIP